MRTTKFILLIGLLAGLFGFANASDKCVSWGDFSSEGQTKIITMETPSSSNFLLEGGLIRRMLIGDEKFQWVGFQLYQASVFLNKEKAQSNEYGVPFAVKVDKKSGAIVDYHFNAKLKWADQNKLKALHRSLYVPPKPKSITGPSYLMTEADDMGLYRSEYREIDKKSIQRKKLDYHKVGDDFSKLGEGLLRIKIPNIIVDEFQFTRNDCWYEKVSGLSETEVESQDGNIRIAVKQTLSLKHNKKPIPSDARLLELPEDPKKWPLLDTLWVYPKAAPAPLPTKKDFLAAVKSLDLLKGDRESILQFLYDNDQYLSALQEQLLNQAYPDDFESKLFLFLGKHDSANAHQLLTGVFLEERMMPNQRFRSLMALRYNSSPIDETLVNSIFQYSTTEKSGENAKLANSALMIMGAVAKNHEGNPFSDSINQRLADALTGSNSDSTSAALLTAMGNSGDSKHQEMITEHLQANSPHLRSAAAHAMSSLPNDSVQAQLSEQLQREKNTKVQSALLRAMGKKPMSESDVDRVFHYASQSKETSVRSSAISALAEQAKSNKDVKTELKRLLKTEQNKNNLRKLMKALHGDS